MSDDRNHKGSFWPSYVDIMTTLFAIMLVLFVVSYSRFKVKEQELQVLADHFIEIVDIYDAASNIDSTKFIYNKEFSKNIFKLDIEYQQKGFDLTSQLKLDLEDKDKADELREQIKDAGLSIKKTIEDLQSNVNLKKDIKYLVVIEGQSSKLRFLDNDTIWRNNYTLSYLRAWNLHKFWKNRGIDFTKMDRCELVICGSGEEGVPRVIADEEELRIKADSLTLAMGYNMQNKHKLIGQLWSKEEEKNQRFLVHIVPIIGKLNMDDNIIDLVKKYRNEGRKDATIK